MAHPTGSWLKEHATELAHASAGAHNETTQTLYYDPISGHLYSVVEWSDDEDQNIVRLSRASPETRSGGDIEVDDLGSAMIIAAPDGLRYLSPDDVEDIHFLLRMEGRGPAVAEVMEHYLGGRYRHIAELFVARIERV